MVKIADMDEKKLTATILFRKQVFEVPAGITVREAIIHCGLNPEAVLATRQSELITDETKIRSGDEIKLIATISGG